jgi:signal transduction histidine kinase
VRISIESRNVHHVSRHPRLESNKQVYEDITIYPLTSNGVEGAVIRIDDVTEQVQMEELMIQSEKILSVGGLAAGMAHEINNPLAGMMQSANVMKNRLERIDMPANLRVAEALGISMGDIKVFMEKREIFRMLDAIQESGARAAEIVSNMLSFARKSDTSTSSHYPDQLMDESLELAATDYDLKKQYDFKSIEIIKEYAQDLPMLLCEGAKIQQVLLNILRNGAQAMQAAKTQSPRFIIRIYKKETPGMVCMEIADNGPGMDDATKSKVFDPFFTTKPVGVGTGLGLSVSYFIITENHKGTLAVSSEPGKGANFIIGLPAQD